MDESQKEELKLKMDSLRDEINHLRKELNDISRKKDDLVQRKRNLEGNFRKELSALSASKKDRNILTKQVKELKVKRDALNKEIKEMIEKVKAAKKAAEKISEKTSKISTGKFKERIHPEQLKREIERMEFSIETEVFSPKKEQELMKILKDKKKLYKEMTASSQSWKEMRALSSEIDKKKREANEAHAKIQELAKESQKKHETLVEVSKKVDPARGEFNEINDALDKIMVDFNSKNAQLKEKLLEISKISGELGVAWKEEDANKPKKYSREEVEKIMASKERNVEEKIRKRQKITTDDLLVFQHQTHQGVHTGHKRRR